jgi:HEAT repeat protein
MDYASFLITELQNGRDRVRREAAKTLAGVADPRVVPALVTALGSDREPYVRKSAAESLGRLGDPQAVPALCAALRNRKSYWSLRQAAAEALGAIGDPEAIPALIVGLSDWRDTVCIASSEALVRISEKAPSPQLRKAVRPLRRRSNDRAVDAAFAAALEKIEYATRHLGELPLPASAPNAAPEDLPIPSSPGEQSRAPHGPEPLSPAEVITRLVKRALGE